MKNYRNLNEFEISQMEDQGCEAANWNDVWFSEPFHATNFKNVTFSGVNYLGNFTGKFEFPGGVTKKNGIYNAVIHNCKIGNNVLINNIRNYIANYDIADNVLIENTDLLSVNGETAFGNGTMVDVMDETGGRQLMIYDRLSAHTAYVMAFYGHYEHLSAQINKMIGDYIAQVSSLRGYIGQNTNITNCNQIINVKIGEYALLNGVSRLKEGSVNSNIYDPVVVGHNVVADNFIFSSGAEVSDHAVITNCFVGQGCVLGKHYSAIHSLFFANCQGFNGEACSIFAGPFTVTHHKSTLLIAGMFSFLNAGSGSNQSNHMYKLGPIHHGIVERGSKTTSDSYLLWPSKIGPFTLVMGRHYKNSDTSNMPFSYLIENQDKSWLVPGINIRSVGTIRDAMKWPKRDKRKDKELQDSINFNLLSPFTIQRMVTGRDLLAQIKRLSGATTETYTWETTFISRDSLQRGIELYNIAIVKFIGNSVISRIEKKKPTTNAELLTCLQPESDCGLGDWIDLAGLIAPKSEVDKLFTGIVSGKIDNLAEVEQYFKDLHNNYYEYEWSWVAGLLEKTLAKPLTEIVVEDLITLIGQWKDSVVTLDKLIYEDAKKEFRLSAQTGFGMDGDDISKELDFIKVRGTFEKNAFVTEVLEHIRKKSELGENMKSFLENLSNK